MHVKSSLGFAALVVMAAGCSFPPPQDVPGAPQLLTINVTGPGTVASADGYIATPGSTSHSYESGAMVTLTATLDAATTALSWGGACSGSDPTCVVTMGQAQTVTAAFSLRQRAIAVSLAGVGSGRVESTTPGVAIDCGDACSTDVPDGTVVTLVATPVPGDVFFGWSGGGCSGTDPCTITVTQVTQVTATFDNCVRNARQCSNSRLLACGADGDFESHLVPNGGLDGEPSMVTYDGTSSSSLCALGCHPTEPRCGDVPASAGLATLLSDVAVSPAGVDVGQSLVLKVIDTEAFDAAAGTVTVTLADDSPYPLPAALLPLPSGGNVLALMVRSLTVPAGTSLTVRGHQSLAVVSHFDIVVAGTVDYSGPNRTALVNDDRACVGAGVGLTTGGGGFGSPGYAGSSGAAGGVSVFPATLQVGCGAGGASRGFGGRGGGAIQLVSRKRVLLRTGALLNVSGGGGTIGCYNLSCLSQPRIAGGGGAGGLVVIEAPTVSVAGGAVVAGRGGNGAAMASTGQDGASPIASMPGANGTTTGTANAGPATCAGCGVGGVGSTETQFGTSGTGTGMAYAGGGGGAGRCLVYNGTGVLTPPAGAMKIYFSIGTLPAPL